jgi:hypothetical protein
MEVFVGRRVRRRRREVLCRRCAHRPAAVCCFQSTPHGCSAVVRNQAAGKPFTSHIRGGDSGYWIDGQRCGPLQKRAVLKRCLSIPSNFPAEQGERAMPMLFWLPIIFVSALWEINGLPLRALANNDQAPV